MTATYTLFDPLLTEAEAATIKGIAETYGAHGMYSDEGENKGIGEGKPQRFDSVVNYLNSYAGVPEEQAQPHTLAARANYFRETYAYGTDIKAPGIEPFLFHEGMVEAAREIHGRPIIEPAIVFANILVPGQELPVHTDVPEFRGANRKVTPQWLLVAMHHSGLFEDWRMPIATCVSWYHDADGGAFVFFPDGADQPAVSHTIKSNTAVIIDTDSVFHGVGRMAENGHPIARLRPGMKIAPEGGDKWMIRSEGEEVDHYQWSDMRLSLSWKAYCFRDEDERRLWAEKADDLTIDFILNRLTDDLRKRGVIEGDTPAPARLAEIIVETYIVFPKPHPDLLPAVFGKAA